MDVDLLLHLCILLLYGKRYIDQFLLKTQVDRTNIPLQIYGNIFDSLIDELSEMEKKKREKKECIFVEIFLSIFFSRISIFVVSYPTKLNLVFYMLFI